MKKWIKLALSSIGITFAIWFVGGVIVEMVTTSRVRASYGNFHYIVVDNDNAVEIVRYRGGTRGGPMQMHIPSNIEGLPVIRIGEYTFTWSQRGTRRGFSIDTVNIPDTVQYIGRGAFARNQLSSVSIPESVTTVSRNAFVSNQISSVDIPGTLVYLSGFNVNNLTSVDIPQGVQLIGDWAFRMNQLTSVSIPDSVVDIGAQAFRHNRLTEVSVPRHTTIANNAFDRDVTITRRDTGIVQAGAQPALNLYGRWMLEEHRTSGVLHTPGHENWWYDYFIELNSDGTFTEMNFWTPEFIATGTWALSGNTLTLNLAGTDGGSFEFVPLRSLSVSADGGTLIMNYRRPPAWAYTGIFSR